MTVLLLSLSFPLLCQREPLKSRRSRQKRSSDIDEIYQCEQPRQNGPISCWTVHVNVMSTDEHLNFGLRSHRREMDMFDEQINDSACR